MLSLHHANIITHVTAGGIALLIGLVILSLPKGDRRHRYLGRTAVTFASAAITAAFVGNLVWRGRLDLLGVNVLTAYQLWSGLRALHLRHGGRDITDWLPALIVSGLGWLGLYLYGRSPGFGWSPGLVYGAIGGLIVYGGLDLIRTLFPLRWRARLNPAEHAFKMTSLVGALASVAAGTVLKGATTYASLIVSGVFALLALTLALRHAVGVTPSAALKARLNTDSEA
jgi:uncharacterized membrane protein